MPIKKYKIGILIKVLQIFSAVLPPMGLKLNIFDGLWQYMIIHRKTYKEIHHDPYSGYVYLQS